MGAFKDELGVAAIDRIAGAIRAVNPAFPHDAFHAQALHGLDALELKARVQHVIAALDAHLEGDLEARLACLIAALDQDVSGFVAWPLIDYVGEHGRHDPAQALPALAKMTHAFSAEFAVRPFLLDDPDSTLQVMQSWTASPSEHIRRLASEGSRPVLPWGIKLPALQADPVRTREILQALRHDDARTVQRSVANHLNDHSRAHPEYVLATIEAWGGCELPWAKHALRTLIKQGNPGVWPLLGHDPNSPVQASLTPPQPARVAIGGELVFEGSVHNPSAQAESLVLDYQLHFVRARGPRSVKVFKLREWTLQPGETRHFVKTHSFRPVTTRRDYPGEHRLILQLNGREEAGFDFDLIEA